MQLEEYERKKAQRKAKSAAASSAVSTAVPKLDSSGGSATKRNGRERAQIPSCIVEKSQDEDVPPEPPEAPVITHSPEGVREEASSASAVRDEHAEAPGTPTERMTGSPVDGFTAPSLPPAPTALPEEFDPEAPNDSLDQQNHRLQAELDLMISTQAAVHEQNSILQHELAGVRSALSAAEEQAEAVSRSHMERIKGLESELKAASATKFELSALREELGTAQLSKKQAETQLAALNAQLAEAQTVLQSKIAQEGNDVAHLGELLRSSQAELQAQEQALQAEVNSLRENLNTLKLEMGKLTDAHDKELVEERAKQKVAQAEVAQLVATGLSTAVQHEAGVEVLRAEIAALTEAASRDRIEHASVIQALEEAAAEAKGSLQNALQGSAASSERCRAALEAQEALELQLQVKDADLAAIGAELKTAEMCLQELTQRSETAEEALAALQAEHADTHAHEQVLVCSDTNSMLYRHFRFTCQLLVNLTRTCCRLDQSPGSDDSAEPCKVLDKTAVSCKWSLTFCLCSEHELFRAGRAQRASNKSGSGQWSSGRRE
jgi:hypothetical protein